MMTWGAAALNRPRRWLLGAVAATVALLLLSMGLPAGRAGETTPTLPQLGPVQQVDTNDVGDPFILTVPHGSYVLFGTTNWHSNVPTATSPDLVHWTDIADALPQLPRWAAPSISMTWAPAVSFVGGRYLMYVTTQEASSGRQCIALAESPTPRGPYVDRSDHPFLCQHTLGGSIDPTVVRGRSGRLSILWKNDGNCCGLPTRIWQQDLSTDGLRLTGSPHQLLSATKPWHQGNVEGPALLPAGDHGWWLFYSAGSWRSADYATGVAYCPSLQGPCHEVLDHPWLPTTATLRTPSGLETLRDHSGHMWVAFTSTVPVRSRRYPDRVYMNRVLNVAPLITSKAAA
jgi:beta-xylosidase